MDGPTMSYLYTLGTNVGIFQGPKVDPSRYYLDRLIHML